MTEIFGNFQDEPSASQEYLILGFSPSSASLKQRWRNNGLSANFIADYLTVFLPVADDQTLTIARQEQIKSAVSFVANELLENAMKFNDYSSLQPVLIQLQLFEDKVVFWVTNAIASTAVQPFQALIQKMITSDPSELLIHQLETNADSTSNSGIGILTMMNDYLAQIGWKFETAQADLQITTVTTRVQLPF
jgi:hypothetical protein